MVSKNANRRIQTVEELLRDRNSLWHILFKQSKDGIVVLEQNGKVFEANQQFADMLGYSSEEIQLLSVWDWDKHFSKKEILKRLRQIDHSGHYFETKQIKKDGTVIDVELSNSATLFNGKKLVFCICRDITQRKLYEEEIYLLATTDTLTGLYNRREFLQRLNREMNFAKRYKTSFALIMYDLDDFKHINDDFGHLEGDNVLKVSAELVKENIRTTDAPARWGGEEFMVLMPQSDIDRARIVAEKLRRSISAYKYHDVFSVTASFGVVAFLPEDDVNSLLKRVDRALYNAKKKGKNRVEAVEEWVEKQESAEA